MSKEKFVLVSLQEDKAKKLAQVITNDSCRKILDYLAEKEATESELAKKLELPISTVHYNLKQLMDGGLVVADEFHYSEKGKEVNHYKLANKYIIIAPKSTYGIKEKLRSILPVALVIGATGLVLQYLSRSKMGTQTAGLMAEKSLMMKTDVAVEESARIAAQSIPIPEAASTMQQIFPNIGWWFIIGGIAALLLFLLIEKARKK